MPEGPLGMPRPGAEPFQTVEFGVYGGIDDIGKRVGERLISEFGTDVGGELTSDDIEGGFIVVPLQTNKVYLEKIENFLNDPGSDMVSNELWNVVARVRGKEGLLRRFAEADQVVTVKYNRMPSDVLDHEMEFEDEIYTQLTEKGWPPGTSTPQFKPIELKSVDVDFDRLETQLEFNKDSINNSDMNAITSTTHPSLTDFQNMVVESLELDSIDEIENLTSRIEDVEMTQISIEAV